MPTEYMQRQVEELRERQLASGKPQTPETARYLATLDKYKLDFATGNGMTLPQLCDFIERRARR